MKILTILTALSLFFGTPLPPEKPELNCYISKVPTQVICVDWAGQRTIKA